MAQCNCAGFGNTEAHKAGVWKQALTGPVASRLVLYCQTVRDRLLMTGPSLRKSDKDLAKLLLCTGVWPGDCCVITSRCLCQDPAKRIPVLLIGDGPGDPSSLDLLLSHAMELNQQGKQCNAS